MDVLLEMRDVPLKVKLGAGSNKKGEELFEDLFGQEAFVEKFSPQTKKQPPTTQAQTDFIDNLK
jgi:hypothetical protein